MAKRPTPKQPKRETATAPREQAAETVSYSTRFDARQRDLVEQAAAIKQWSPASLIREAAVTRAAGIVNASGSAGGALHVLAYQVADQLLVPEPRPENRDPYEQPIDADPITGEQFWEPRKVRRPDMATLRQIREALETCGTTFIELVLDRWNALEADNTWYSPTVRPVDVLKGDSTAESARTAGDPRQQ